jgi:sigma-E factor negative regulatory protein RseB
MMLDKMFSISVNSTVLLLLATFSVSAEPFSQDDLSWLKKMVLATHETDYSGTFLYQSADYVEISRITHLLDGEDEHERLEGLDGERSEVIRKNDRVWCYLGATKVMVANRDGSKMFPALLPREFTLLQDNYVLRRGEEDRVAGFNTYSILFQPRDKMRYTRKMWAHSDTGLLLKAVVMDERDQIVEQYTFTQLNIGGEIDRKWIVRSKSAFQENTTEQIAGASAVPSIGANNNTVLSGWKVYALPAGFKKMTERNRPMKGGQKSATHMVYSDGLAGISVFIEKLSDKSDAKPGLYSKGGLQIFIKTLDKNLLTVVGEVPPRTVMQVAESIRYGGPAK